MLLAALVIGQVNYWFPPETPLDYGLKVEFDGFIPMLGGMEGKIDVDLGFAVRGQVADAANMLKVTSEVSRAEIRLDGEKMPFGVDNIKQFFPKNTISATLLGEIKENDAPNIKLPIRLPGLDVKRIPEITYMPIHFPLVFEEGKPFSYEKPFGDSKMTYEVTPVFGKGGDVMTFKVKLSQNYTNYEDEAKNLVEKEADATATVVTQMEGGGTITFDTFRKLVTESRIVADSESTVRAKKTGAVTKRKLKTTLVCTLAK